MFLVLRLWSDRRQFLAITEATMDSVTAFNVFVRVAETRSFVAAGQLLGVSASAVGKSVSRLESRLAVRLFHRSTRSISLTAEGSKFLERSRHILAEIVAAEAELSQASTTPRGRLRIGLPLAGKPFLPTARRIPACLPGSSARFEFQRRQGRGDRRGIRCGGARRRCGGLAADCHAALRLPNAVGRFA